MQRCRLAGRTPKTHPAVRNEITDPSGGAGPHVAAVRRSHTLGLAV